MKGNIVAVRKSLGSDAKQTQIKIKTDTATAHDSSSFCLSNTNITSELLHLLLTIKATKKCNTFPPEQQNIKLKVSSEIRHCDCRKPPSTLRNQILRLTVGASQGEVGIHVQHAQI